MHDQNLASLPTTFSPQVQQTARELLVLRELAMAGPQPGIQMVVAADRVPLPPGQRDALLAALGHPGPLTCRREVLVLVTTGLGTVFRRGLVHGEDVHTLVAALRRAHVRGADQGGGAVVPGGGCVWAWARWEGGRRGRSRRVCISCMCVCVRARGLIAPGGCAAPGRHHRRMLPPPPALCRPAAARGLGPP